MNISMIAAVSENNVIGRDNGIPWKIKSDMRRFKETTMGCPVIMGRKTFESIGRPEGLPGRLNVVVSSKFKLIHTDNLVYAQTLEEAVFSCPKDKEIFLIGGQRIYEEGMKHANKLYISHIHANVEGDTFFPEIDPTIWEEVYREDLPQGEEDEYPFSVVVYRRGE